MALTIESSIIDWRLDGVLGYKLLGHFAVFKLVQYLGKEVRTQKLFPVQKVCLVSIDNLISVSLELVFKDRK